VTLQGEKLFLGGKKLRRCSVGLVLRQALGVIVEIVGTVADNQRRRMRVRGQVHTTKSARTAFAVAYVIPVRTGL
jgi:hypothetical protein